MLYLLYKIYIVLVMLPIIAVATILTAVTTAVTSALGAGRWGGYYPEVLWARIFCWMAFVRVTVRGRENITKGTSYVFVANHEGAYDIFSIFGYLGHNFRWMMRASLGKIPFVGWGCRAAKQIFVDNSSPSATRRTMQAAEKELRDGMSLVVFPEGTRCYDGKMQPFRRGAFKLALEFGLPVVPLTVNGSFEVMPRTAHFPRPGHITIIIHKPIPATDQDTVSSKAFEAITKDLD